jgi:hypothetical protein
VRARHREPRYGVETLIAGLSSGLSLAPAMVMSPDGGGAAIRLACYMSGMIRHRPSASTPRCPARTRKRKMDRQPQPSLPAQVGDELVKVILRTSSGRDGCCPGAARSGWFRPCGARRLFPRLFVRRSRAAGRGIGGGVLDAVLAEAERRRQPWVHPLTHADNERSQQLYRSRGFSPTGRRADGQDEWVSQAGFPGHETRCPD